MTLLSVLGFSDVNHFKKYVSQAHEYLGPLKGAEIKNEKYFCLKNTFCFD